MPRFRWRLLAIGVLALAIRLAFAFTVAHDQPHGGVDASRYTDLATSIAAGDGYAFHVGHRAFGEFDTRSTQIEPDGQHPPVHPALLAGADLLGFHSADAHRAAAALVSALGVVFTGLAGRRLVGPSVGLVAAAIAALNPLWFQYAGYLESEASLLFVVPLTLWLASVVLDTGRLLAFLALGASIGVCALTRSETLLLVVVLGVPLVLLARDRRRLAAMGTLLLGAALVVGPWIIRNDRVFGEPAISYNTGVTLAGANCDQAYHGRRLGGYGDGGFLAAGAVRRFSGHPVNQAQMDRGTRDIARRYVGDHLGRLPVVVLARAGRTAGVFRLGDSMDFDVTVGANRAYQWIGYVVGWISGALAVAGAVVLFRGARRRQLAVLASGPVLALVTGVLAYGATRFRVVAEPAIAILAAAALVEVARRWRGAQRSSGSTPAPHP